MASKMTTKAESWLKRYAELDLALSKMSANEVPPANLSSTHHEEKASAVNGVRSLTFTDLPSELRNRIYEFVLYHNENDGIIAPVHTGNETFRTVYKGEEVNAEHAVTNDVRSVPVRQSCSYAQFKELNRIAKATNCHVLKIHQPTRFDAVHLCTMKCLVQPALTKVSRQLREETLPIFYGVNSFYFLQSFSFVTEGQRWWRTIEDSNLRMIKNFRFAPSYTSTSFEMKRKGERNEVKLTFKPGTEMYTKTVQEWRASEAARESFLIDLEIIGWNWDSLSLTWIKDYGKDLDLAAIIEEDGLFVMALEEFLERHPKEVTEDER